MNAVMLRRGNDDNTRVNLSLAHCAAHIRLNHLPAAFASKDESGSPFKEKFADVLKHARGGWRCVAGLGLPK